MKIGKVKNQSRILEKLGIEALNPMQEEAKLSIHSHNEIVLQSPTGTGKTLAFLLPIIAEMDRNCEEVQSIIIVPSRELAIQIEQVARDMGSGFKTNAVYGGRQFSKDKINLKHPPALLIGTPGRIADHLRRHTFSTASIIVMVLDEFDKSLEVGFHKEMEEIITALPHIKKKILTSATNAVEIPEFIGLTNPQFLDFTDQNLKQLKVKAILSPSKDKLETLGIALNHLGTKTGIIFCNYKESIHRISTFLIENEIEHGCFYGGMEQKDRERALIKFRNGTHRLIVATDLAARGIDVSELDFILHYHIPLKEEEFIHRNGRTARMHSEGTAFVLKWTDEELPDFMGTLEVEELLPAPPPPPTDWETIFISGGRKDKISKGDIAGLFLKQGKLTKDEIGLIELKQDCAFVSVHATKTQELLNLVNNSKLKKKKVSLSVV